MLSNKNEYYLESQNLSFLYGFFKLRNFSFNTIVLHFFSRTFPELIVNADCCFCPLCRFKSPFIRDEKVRRSVVATSRGRGG